MSRMPSLASPSGPRKPVMSTVCSFHESSNIHDFVTGVPTPIPLSNFRIGADSFVGLRFMTVSLPGRDYPMLRLDEEKHGLGLRLIALRLLSLAEVRREIEVLSPAVIEPGVGGGAAGHRL